MRSKLRNPLILLASVFLGFMLASQVSSGTFIPSQIMTFQNYQQVSSEIKKLTDEINILNEKKDEMEQDLSGYENMGQSSSEAMDKLSGDISKYEYYSGLTDVEGPGVVISLADNPIKDGPDAPYEIISSTLIHDSYLRDMVADLKNAGAEAISINDQRVVSNTEFYCEGPVIWVNRVSCVSPYIIKAIGDPEALAFILNDEDHTYKKLEKNLLMVNFRKENTIKIYKYDGSTVSTYMKPASEDK